MSKKIIFVSKNFYPETNAASSRIYERLTYFLDENFEIYVVCPNFNTVVGFEDNPVLSKIKLIRVFTPFSTSQSLLLRALSSLTFLTLGFLKLVAINDRESIVFASSPPFSTLLSALLSSKIKKSKLVVEIADLWPDTLLHLGYLKKTSFVYKVWKSLEKLVYKNADLIVSLSESISNQIEMQIKNHSSKLITARNGFKEDFWSSNKEQFSEKFTIGYYGKFGRAQAIDNVIEAAQKLQSEQDMHFILVGSGSEFLRLSKLAEEYGLKNLEILPEVSKQDLRKLWSKTNLCVVSLKDSKVFDTAIPSKITESIGTNTPILIATKDCEASRVVHENGFGLVCAPEAPDELAKCILEIKTNPELYQNFVNNICAKKHDFTRKAQAYRVISAINKL